MLTTLRFPLLASCFLAAVPLACGQPSITAVVNGASFEPGVAPGSLVVIYGKGLANSSLSNPGLPLPTVLAGATVEVNGVAAALHYVSDTQVNAVIPAETPAGGTVPVVVRTESGASQPFRLKVERCAPAIFTRVGNGTGRAIVFSAAYRLLDQVAPGEAVSFYATGLGATAAGQDGYSRTVVTPSLYIGESQSVISYSGPSGYPGVYQVNAVVPGALASERFYLTCAPAPYPSNISEIGIPAGQNTVDASGDIQALYPRAASTLTFSQVLMAAKFHVRFTPAPGARPFAVAAVSDAASMVFTVEPASGRITGTSRVPTDAERHWDFSLTSRGSAFSVIDFLSNGNPMPGNIVPAVRVDPAANAASGSLPLPNSGSGDAANYTYEARLPSSGPVALDDFTNANTFGNFLPIPYAPWLASRNAGFKLYVDGRLIASDKVTYALPAPPPPVAVALKDITLTPASIAGGTPIQGAVNLTGPAPAGGIAVTLQSDNAAAAVPAGVTVAAGQTSATFTVTTRAVAVRTTVVITARAGSDSRTASLTVNAPAGIAGPFGMLFVSIPAGAFMMGCSPGDAECFASESPQRRVQITRSFEMGTFEVTQAQWQAAMSANPSWTSGTDNANRPVQQVTWNDVQGFLSALNARNDGYRYRLPTEAEWEYAARAGATDKYAGGSKAEVACTGLYNTCIVGQLKPNAWGLYDMLGSVREYCQDWYDENYYATGPTVDPQGPATGTQRVNRGGSWGIGGDGLLRVSARAAFLPDLKNVTCGFRCVRQKIGN